MTGECLHPGGLALTDRAVERCGLLPGARILDVGCGAGTTVRYLRSTGLRAWGIDLAGAGASLRADGQRLPFAAGAFDGVLLECSLSLMPDLDAALAEFARVLVPGGRLAVSDLYARQAPAGRFFTREGLLAALEGRFAVDLWEDHSSTLAPFVARRLLSSMTEGTGMVDTIACGRRVRAGYFLLIAKEHYDHA